MAFEMEPTSNVDRRHLRFSKGPQASGYATLETPFDQPAHDKSDHEFSDLPSSAPPLGPTYSKPDSSRSISDFDVETSYDTYGSRTHMDAGGYAGPHAQSPPSRYGHPWQPGFFEQFPWLGITALVGTVLFTFAAIAVLVASNGRPIGSWSATLQPTVYISISTAAANILLTYALYQGIVISFWRKAGQGATLMELHQYWSSGSSFYGAMRGIFVWRGRTAALACIMTVVSILRGPLMQRASSVANVVSHTAGNTTVHVATSLPLGWAGSDSGRTSSPSYLNPNFTTVMQSYSNRGSIPLTHSDCGSSCRTSIKGFGFGVTCTTSGIFYNLAPTVYANGSVTLLDPLEVFSVLASTRTVFNHGNASEADYYGNLPGSPDYDKDYEQINTGVLLNTILINHSTEAYNGTMQNHQCVLRGGVVSYPVIITNGTVSLQSASWRNDTFVEDRGLNPLEYNGLSNLGGFVLAANNLYQSSANLQFGGGVGWILNFQGFLANQYINPTTPGQNYYAVSQSMSWRDPMEDVINGMREIAFRAAVDVANHNLTFPESIQRVTYVGSRPETVYESNYRYMATAAVVSLLGVLAVIPTFRGWWELGRKVTLSPLEVAKAFDAPLLGGAQSNAGAEQMLKEIGDSRVRYGDVTGGMGPNGAARKLQILPVELVSPPTKGLRYA